MATNREWALRMIPVLVRWAQATWDKPHYYSDLSAAVGHKTNQTGAAIGIIQDILEELSQKTGKKIPTLNCLVQSKSTGLPSDGFDYVIPNYSKLSPESQRGEVNKLNYDAHIYDWTWVLKALRLKPAKIISEAEPVQLNINCYGNGGEGKEHKELKRYISNHPDHSRLGIKKVIRTEIEHDLLSGDSLDVYFETKKCHYAIEVKPSTSPKEDILRGIFQCIKYKAVMDAERVKYLNNYENKVILVMAGEITPDNKQIAADLGIRVEDKFKME